MTIEKITINNIDKMKESYNKFSSEAISSYKFDKPPLRFEELKTNIQDEFLEGYLNDDGGFLFFTTKINEAVELNLIYAEFLEDKVELLKAFLAEIKDYKVISFPLMGEQSDLLPEIKKLGFDCVEQCILKLKVNDRYNLTQIQKKGKATPIIKKWDNKYIDEVASLINKAFESSSDSKFDPRFKTLEGSKTIVENIINSDYGPFNPEFTALSFDGDKITGVCFVTFSNLKTAVVPLVAVLPEYHNQGIGSAVLKHALIFTITSAYKPDYIMTTVDNQNDQANSMYKKLGFKESHSYRHAFLVG